ncbi:MAG: chlorophyllase/cutinase-like alpha/beta fold protein [Myxococcota bacterium]
MRFRHLLFALLCLVALGACTEDSPGSGANNGDEQDAIVDSSDHDSSEEDATGTDDAADDTSASQDTSSTDTSGADTTTTDTGTEDTGTADTGTVEDASEDDTVNNSGLYVGTGDPYAAGALDVTSVSVAASGNGSPLPLEIWAPSDQGTYAVVLFQHGFQLENGYYSTILSQLASHGFIVVAPQLAGGLTGGPTAAEDAVKVQDTLDWLETNLDGELDATPSFDHVGLSGHSRGAKVVWIVMTEDASYGDALAGVDPVDGTGGPLGGEERVIDGTFSFAPPTFILGTGLGPETQFGQACAPDGDNHVQFYGASQSPAWHVVATEYGHMDMIDANSGCGFTCNACPAGTDLAKMRTLTGGMLVAFFRGSLQGDNSAYSVLLDTNSAPAAITAESK